MYKYHCLNPISAVGLDQLDEKLCECGDCKRSRRYSCAKRKDARDGV